jgi:hypothetical protein
VPAAAVIPAPIAYIKVVAVKKLVVGFRDAHSSVRVIGSNRWRVALRARSAGGPACQPARPSPPSGFPFLLLS